MRVDEIRITRKNMYEKSSQIIRDFLEDFSF